MAALTRSKIFLVDDHPLVRDGLRTLLSAEPDLEVCGVAETSAQALTGISASRPDVAIVDLSLSSDSGLDLVRTLQTLPQPPRVLVLSMHDETQYAERALRAGALGYVMKSETSGNVVAALREILRGRLFVSKAVSELMAQKYIGNKGAHALSLTARLSDRELEVFTRIGQGHENRRIAEDLHLSLKTVQTHCTHIKEKLGLENATALMLEAVRWVESETGA